MAKIVILDILQPDPEFPGGISFAEGQVTRIIGHTHPYGMGAVGPSAADAAALRALGQRHSYVIEGGNIIRFGQ